MTVPGSHTGPASTLAPLLATVRNGVMFDRFNSDGTISSLHTNALAALASIEQRVQEDVEDWEQIAAQKGLPFLLDHLGLDGLANEVMSLKQRVQEMETALEFYADSATYAETSSGPPNSFGLHDTTSVPIWDDHGETARSALPASGTSGAGTDGKEGEA